MKYLNKLERLNAKAAKKQEKTNAKLAYQRACLKNPDIPDPKGFWDRVSSAASTVKGGVVYTAGKAGDVINTANTVTSIVAVGTASVLKGQTKVQLVAKLQKAERVVLASDFR